MLWNMIKWKCRFLWLFSTNGWRKFYRRLESKIFGRNSCRVDYWGTSSWDDGYIKFPMHWLFSWTKWLFGGRFTFWILSKQHRFVWSDEVHSQPMIFIHDTFYFQFGYQGATRIWLEIFHGKVCIVFNYTYLELCEWNAWWFNSFYLLWLCNPTLVSYV